MERTSGGWSQRSSSRRGARAAPERKGRGTLRQICPFAGGFAPIAPGRDVGSGSARAPDGGATHDCWVIPFDSNENEARRREDRAARWRGNRVGPNRKASGEDFYRRTAQPIRCLCLGRLFFLAGKIVELRELRHQQPSFFAARWRDLGRIAPQFAAYRPRWTSRRLHLGTKTRGADARRALRLDRAVREGEGGSGRVSFLSCIGFSGVNSFGARWVPRTIIPRGGSRRRSWATLELFGRALRGVRRGR